MPLTVDVIRVIRVLYVFEVKSTLKDLLELAIWKLRVEKSRVQLYEVRAQLEANVRERGHLLK